MSNRNGNGSSLGGFLFLLAAVIVIIAIIGGILLAWPNYNVWRREMSGKAELQEATWNRQIAVEEAQAELESASLLRDAEVVRAGGVAEAIEIIGDSLQDNESYLRYLWIQSLHDSYGEVIYVPTEANLPILEAGRLNVPVPAE